MSWDATAATSATQSFEWIKAHRGRISYVPEANASMPAGIIECDEKITPEDAAEVSRVWGEAARAGSAIVLPPGMRYMPLNVQSPDEEPEPTPDVLDADPPQAVTRGGSCVPVSYLEQINEEPARITRGGADKTERERAMATQTNLKPSICHPTTSMPSINWAPWLGAAAIVASWVLAWPSLMKVWEVVT